MPFASDSWMFPAVGNEAGMDYAEVEGMRVYLAYSLVPLAQYADGAVEKIGYCVHHDAVPFTGGTIADEVARITAIDTYHRNHNGWAGIGYHRVIAPSGRVYIVGPSSTQRAHVAGLNHLWIGYCFLGDYTNGRPPEPAMHALRTVLQWETNQRQMPMAMRAHKGLNPGTTACPGGWATENSWTDITLQPQQPPLPGIPAPPAPPNVGQIKQQLAALVAQLPD